MVVTHGVICIYGYRKIRRVVRVDQKYDWEQDTQGGIVVLEYNGMTAFSIFREELYDAKMNQEKTRLLALSFSPTKNYPEGKRH